MLKIIQLGGTDSKLYELVAPLVMNPDIIKYNNNYPFKTKDSFKWFVAVEGGDVVGFFPVEVKGRKMTINNYYVDTSMEKSLFPCLLKAVVEKMYDKKKILEAVVMTRHAEYFEAEGFEVVKKWTLYLRMEKA